MSYIYQCITAIFYLLSCHSFLVETTMETALIFLTVDIISILEKNDHWGIFIGLAA